MPYSNDEAIDFISRSVRFLHHWPIQELKGNSQACSVYYFDRNQVLVRDSNSSDWIYIVLKGSLSVIKKLKRVEAREDVNGLTKRQRVSFGDSKIKRRPLHRHSFNGISKFKNSHRRFPDLNTRHTVSLDSSLTNGLSGQSSWVSSISSDIPETPPVYFRNVMELEHRLEQTLPGYHNSVDRLGCLDYDQIIHEHKARLLQKSPVMGTKRTRGPLIEEYMENGTSVTNESSQQRRRKNGHSETLQNPHKSSFLPNISNNNGVAQSNRLMNGNISHDDEDADNEDDHTIMNQHPHYHNHHHHHHHHNDNDTDGEDKDLNLLNGAENNALLRKKRKKIRKTSKGVYLATSHKEVIQEPKTPRLSSDRVSSPVSGDDLDKNGSVDEDLFTRGKEESISEKLAKLQIQYQRRVTEGEGRKTIAEELDFKARREYKFTEADLDPTIIELQVLEKGQYFGLSPMLFPDQPSLSVTSNGAECVVISKKFFLKMASEKCLRHLRQTESPYPSDDQLRLKLQEMVNWQSKRSSMYRSLESKILEKQAKRKQFLPYYQGQYCYRTGPI